MYPRVHSIFLGALVSWSIWYIFYSINTFVISQLLHQDKLAPGLVMERALVRQLAVSQVTGARFEVIVRIAMKKSLPQLPPVVLLEELTLSIDTLLQAYPGRL